jgi:hypothetical protein
VKRTLPIIQYHTPTWWALENPAGRLPRLVPELAPFGPWYFHPHEFGAWIGGGDAYTKKTGIWGVFTVPERKLVAPVRVCAQGRWLQALGGKRERTTELRSMTPLGFAAAFFHANPQEPSGELGAVLDPKKVAVEEAVGQV